MTVAKLQTPMSFEELLVSLSTFNSSLKFDEMKLSREGYFFFQSFWGKLFTWSLQCKVILAHLSPVTQARRLQIAWRLPASGMVPQALLHVLCVKVRWWRGKTKKKSKCSVLCGQQFLQDTSGEFLSEKETCVCFSSLIMSVFMKNLKRTRNDCYNLRIYSGTVVQCNGWL